MSHDGPRMAALALWRRELAAGLRRPTTFDALWRAAIYEIEAEEAEATALHDLAAGKCLLAAAIIVADAQHQVEATTVP